MAILDEDVVRVRGDRFDKFTGKTKPNRPIRVLYWGDTVDLVDPGENDDPDVREVRVRLYRPYDGATQDGTIRKKRSRGENLPLRFREPDDHLLEVTFVDVQQGDATLIRTPDRKTVLVDGGEGKFIARLLAATFGGTTEDDPLVFDALVVTHGDADHFAGLFEVARAADYDVPRKELHAKVLRYFHNGLVKLPRTIEVDGAERKLGTTARFGASVESGGEIYVTDLWDDPRDAPHMNEPFTEWGEALDRLVEGADGLGGDAAPGEHLPIVRRVAFGDGDAFRVFTDPVEFRVLGPIVDRVEVDGGAVDGLEFLRGETGGRSMSHTINGHSVVLKMTYDNVDFMLGGDLNTHASERLLEHAQAAGVDLRSEVLKVPHHGSHEYAPELLHAIAPVVSVVSSGDENVMKEYVHPRANLMAALGRHSRGPQPLVFCTELAAFFAYRGYVSPELHKLDDEGDVVLDGDGRAKLIPKSRRHRGFHAFQRLVFGAVRVRTDGERVLVAVESASDNIKEAYAFRVDGAGEITLDEVGLI